VVMMVYARQQGLSLPDYAAPSPASGSRYRCSYE